jgi:precorrin-2 C20-methyltransferase/precorrin-3B C17-methyltransferase
VVVQRLEAAASADLVIALYNPASKTRRQQIADTRELLLKYRDPSTPVVIGRAVGSAEQEVRVVTLDTLDPEQIDMRCLLIVGSSQTRAVPGRDGQTRVFTPRHYPDSPVGAGYEPAHRLGD